MSWQQLLSSQARYSGWWQKMCWNTVLLQHFYCRETCPFTILVPGKFSFHQEVPDRTPCERLFPEWGYLPYLKVETESCLEIASKFSPPIEAILNVLNTAKCSLHGKDIQRWAQTQNNHSLALSGNPTLFIFWTHLQHFYQAQISQYAYHLSNNLWRHMKSFYLGKEKKYSWCWVMVLLTAVSHGFSSAVVWAYTNQRRILTLLFQTETSQQYPRTRAGFRGGGDYEDWETSRAPSAFCAVRSEMPRSKLVAAGLFHHQGPVMECPP